MAAEELELISESDSTLPGSHVCNVDSVQADLAENGRTLRRVGKSLEAEEARLKEAAEAASSREATAAAAAAEAAAAQQRARDKEADLERLHADVWAKVQQPWYIILVIDTSLLPVHTQFWV